MKKIIRLTESDLTRIVKRIIKENDKGQYGEYTADTAYEEVLSYVKDIGCSEGKNRLLQDVIRFVENTQKELSDEEFEKFQNRIDGLEQQINEFCSDDDEDEDDDFYHRGEGPGGRW